MTSEMDRLDVLDVPLRSTIELFPFDVFEINTDLIKHLIKGSFRTELEEIG